MAGNSEAGLQSSRRISVVVALLVVGVCGIASAQDWRSQDLGGAGSAAENNGVWTIQAAGSDIWGTADSFQFLFHPANLQSGRLTVRVDDLQNTNAFAKSGLMLRSGLEDVSAANVILDVKPSGEVEFMARATDGGETAYLAGAFVTMPAWLRLEWTPVNGGTVTGYVSQDSVTWSQVGTVTYPTALVGDVGIAVTSHDLQQLTTSHLEGLSVVPLGWLNTDVGNTGLTGNTADVAGGGLSFRVAGAGADIWGAADAFQYVFQTTASVTAIIQARILSEDAADPFAKVGVMIRNGNTPDAPFVILDLKPNGELEFMQRSIAGGDVTYLGGAMPGFNTWIRLVREDTYLRADYSSDGFNTWKVVGVTSVDMPLAVSAGVAVTSHDVTQLNTSLVDQVAITNGEP